MTVPLHTAKYILSIFILKLKKACSSTSLEIKETRRKYHINGNVCLSFLDILELPLYHECRDVGATQGLYLQQSCFSFPTNIDNSVV